MIELVIPARKKDLGGFEVGRVLPFPQRQMVGPFIFLDHMGPAHFDVDDLSIALIKLRSGRTVLLEASWAAHGPLNDANGTQLFGTEAGLLMPPVQLFRQSRTGYVTEAVDPLPPLVNTNRMVHFIDCLLGKAKPFVKPSESLAVQKILDAIYISASSGREVRIK